MVAAAPHAGQNRASAGNGSPQALQGAVSVLPHEAQNRPPSGFSAAHIGQVRMHPSVFAATDGEEVRTRVTRSERLTRRTPAPRSVAEAGA